MKTFLFICAALILIMAGCNSQIEKPATPAGVSPPEDDGTPGELWNEDVTHVDGDSIEAGAFSNFTPAEALGINDYTSCPWGFHLPFRGCWYMTCGYGCGLHTGNDYYSTDWAVAGNPCGYDVLAPGAGWVLWAGYKNGYGYTVLIEAGPSGLPNGSRYIYRVAHLSRIDVVPGWWLPQGYRIGLHGRSGGNWPCHLHWTIYRGTYAGYGNVNGASFPPSWSTGIDRFNGNLGRWCSGF